METKNRDEISLPRGFPVGVSPFRYEGEMFTAGQMRAYAEAERERCIDILMRLQEQAGDSHNYYTYAANTLRGEI